MNGSHDNRACCPAIDCVLRTSTGIHAHNARPSVFFYNDRPYALALLTTLSSTLQIISFARSLIGVLLVRIASLNTERTVETFTKERRRYLLVKLLKLANSCID